MKTLAIVNQKGGSGKTTTAVNLAAALAELNKRVLLIDLDPQASSSLWYGVKEKGQGLFELFTKGKSLGEIVEKTRIGNLSLVPSSPFLAGVEKALANAQGCEKILRLELEKVEKKMWDYVLIDCPPTLGILSLNALTAADQVLVPVESHVMALHGLVQLLRTINHVKKQLNSELEILGILPCRVDSRTKHTKEILAQLRERFPDKVLQCVIRENIRLAEAPLHLQPIMEYDTDSSGAKDYRELAQELLQKYKN